MNHAHNPTTSAEAPIRIGHRYRPISSPIASRPARASLLGGASWSAHGSGGEAAQTATARAPARERGGGGGRARPSGGRGAHRGWGGGGGKARGEPQHAIRTPIAFHEPPVALERL